MSTFKQLAFNMVQS